MIHSKAFEVQKLAALSPLGISTSAGTKRSAPQHDSDAGVLTSLFRSRMDCGTHASMHAGQPDPMQPPRATPLVSTMTGEEPCLFPRSVSGSKRFKRSSSLLLNGQTTHIYPFPLSTDLLTNQRPSSSPAPSSSHDQVLLDQSLRSLSAALMITRETTSPCETTTMKAKKRPRNLATRIRLVAQAMGGQKRVQELMQVVNDLKQSNNDQTEPLVDAWENTSLNDMKSLPWEDLLQSAQKKLAAGAC